MCAVCAAALRADPEYVCSGAELPEIGAHDIVSISDTAPIRWNEQDDETNNGAGQSFQTGNRLEKNLITGVTFYGYSFWPSPEHVPWANLIVIIRIREGGRGGPLIASQTFQRPAVLQPGYLTFMFDTKPGESFTWADENMEQDYKDEASGLVRFGRNTTFAVDTQSLNGGWRLNLYDADLIPGQFYVNHWEGWGGRDRRCVLHIATPPSTLMILK